MYNLTNITAANDIYEIVKATNELSGGLLFNMLMFLFFMVFLMVNYKRDFKKVLLADSFITILIAGVAWGLQLVTWTYIIVPIVIFIGSLILFTMLD